MTAPATELAPSLSHPSLARLRADVAAAARVVAPSWPLTSFVAVNPLGGFEHLPFADACREARQRFGARTHLSPTEFRARHAAGRITDAHLRLAILSGDPLLAAEPPVTVAGREVDVVDVLVADLVVGPVAPTSPDERRAPSPADDLDRRELAAYVARWCTSYADDSAAPLALPGQEAGLFRAWHRLCADDRRLRRLVGRAAHEWIVTLPHDGAAALHDAFTVSGVADADRLEALRDYAVRLPGWVGYARWCDEWAPDHHDGPRLRVIDVLAMLAVLDAALGVRWQPPVPADDPGPSLETRVEAALAALGVDGPTDDDREAVSAVLARLPDPDRAMVWLTAHESAYRDELLGALQAAPSVAAPGAPLAHVVTCIDVRSEVLRRHLEATGPYDTYGFAGFFGVPVWWRPQASDAVEARCPVLVTPRYEVTEKSDDDASSPTTRRRELTRGAKGAYHGAKGGLGSPFALAEAAGWLLGPLAAARTLLAGRSGRSRAASPTESTTVDIDPTDDASSGLPLAERILFAEAILSTIGLDPVAPLIVLCGHGSHTVNNPHASSLDCGACGGAPGGANARVAAAILNDPEVRAGLRERGVGLGLDTWVIAAEHDTTSDRVTILDRHLVPEAFTEPVRRLEADLASAGEATSRERAERLPGDPRGVRQRGDDWAQVRPEWGLAGNAAFVAAPRTLTRTVDLGGRSFLHSYDADTDPDGVALETILTAPLVVAQWISCQYYFSTVDPDVFGAGDKMLHNPVGGVGVVLGEGGDLAVGLPTQSVRLGDRLGHEPLRLLAVVQAPLERIEEIIGRNPGLRHLVDNGWITLAARSSETDPWSLRSQHGTWTMWHAADTMPGLTTDHGERAMPQPTPT